MPGDAMPRYRMKEGIVVADLPEGVGVFDPAGSALHVLNQVAAAVLLLCEGHLTADDIAGILMETYGLAEPPSGDVLGCLAQLRDLRLIVEAEDPGQPMHGLSREAYGIFAEAWEGEVAQARTLRFDPAKQAGRGIVIPAGGARLFACAWVAIRMLRDRLKCSLPIEVWHLGPKEMSPAMRSILEEQDVAVIDATERGGFTPSGPFAGWELKAFALLHCRFAEVIMIDADNVPVIDPDCLFETQDYRETGALFWPDVVELTMTSEAWRLCGVAYRRMPSFESGQMVIDKRRHLGCLSLAWFLNRHGEVTYRFVYGDKDTFLLSWLRLAASFVLIPHPARNAKGSVGQHHPDGRLMFQHRNGAKWVLTGANPAIPGFVDEDRCFRYLRELQNSWNGRIFLPPETSEAGCRLEAEVVAQRYFVYELVGDRRWALELLPANRVGRGFDLHESQWWIEDAGPEPLLCIGEDAQVHVKLRRVTTGQWRGVWEAGRALPVVLEASPWRADLARDGLLHADYYWMNIRDNYRAVQDEA